MSRITTTVAMAVALTGWGLSAPAQEVGGGLKGGLSLGDMPEASDLNPECCGVTSKWRTGFAAGGFLTWQFENGFALQPEALYTQKGMKLSVRQASASGGFTAKFDFVDVPVLARYTFGRGRTRGYLLAGPSFDFKVSAKAATDVNGASTEQDLGEQVDSFELALVVGGGVELGAVLVEGRWSEGLTGIQHGASIDGVVTPFTIKTRTVLVLGGVRF